MIVCGDKLSPVIHLRLSTPAPSPEDGKHLNKIANYCIKQGVAVVTAKYLPDEMLIPQTRYVRKWGGRHTLVQLLFYSLRLTVCLESTDEELRKAADVIGEAIERTPLIN